MDGTYTHEHSIKQIKVARSAASRIADVFGVLLVTAATIEWSVRGQYLPDYLILLLTAGTVTAWLCYVIAWCACHMLRAIKVQAEDAAERARADYYLELINKEKGEPGPGSGRRRLSSVE